jgi:uncharacterized protein (TIGR02145 family)
MKNNSINKSFGLIIISSLILACTNSNENSTSGQPAVTPIEQAPTQTEIKQPEIATIAIAELNWMTENLKTTSFTNGDPIKEVKSDKEWADASKSKTPAYRIKDGVYLYNGYAVKDQKGIAPVGFHVATTANFKALMKAAGGGSSSEGKAPKELANYTWSYEGWDPVEESLGSVKVKGKNSIGFNASKGGFCYDTGSLNLGNCSYWWTSDGDCFDIGYCSQDLGGGFASKLANGYGFEVRCVKN